MDGFVDEIQIFAETALTFHGIKWRGVVIRISGERRNLNKFTLLRTKPVYDNPEQARSGAFRLYHGQ